MYAVQAVANGNASADQQKRAIAWIVGTLCGTYDLAFRPDDHGGSRDTDFALGKAFVGQQIVKLLKLHLLAADAEEATSET